ncbi:hypothetical protein BDZ97DRAFT_1778388 [Flammula alnicola]|nr:hypothetical protein BDZ97DRAFT_1778388 [Flammula alnicola]
MDVPPAQASAVSCERAFFPARKPVLHVGTESVVNSSRLFRFSSTNLGQPDFSLWLNKRGGLQHFSPPNRTDKTETTIDELMKAGKIEELQDLVGNSERS